MFAEDWDSSSWNLDTLFVPRLRARCRRQSNALYPIPEPTHCRTFLRLGAHQRPYLGAGIPKQWRYPIARQCPTTTSARFREGQTVRTRRPLEAAEQ